MNATLTDITRNEFPHEFKFTGDMPPKNSGINDISEAEAAGYYARRRDIPRVCYRGFVIANPEGYYGSIITNGIFSTDDKTDALIAGAQMFSGPILCKLPYREVYVKNEINNLGQPGAYVTMLPIVVWDEFVAFAKAYIDENFNTGCS